MREIAFIKQNKETWQEFEQIVVNKTQKDPDALAAIYLKLTNDLAFAQTYYPKSKITTYLNNLTALLFLRIYKKKRNNSEDILTFFKIDVPLLAYKYRYYMYLAFGLYAIFMAIGIISALYNEEFVRYILGDYYVDMTLVNIENGNPVAVYKGSDEVLSSFSITTNNLLVGAKMYLYGFLCGIGTLYILLTNSIMVGAFQTFFYTHGVFLESVRGIWLHGSMEIFAMVIEASAGLIMAGSILFPGTYSRLESIKKGFLNSFKIFISTLPFTVAAGLIEGFVTRWSKEMPNSVNYLIIAITLGCISFYYLIYPILCAKKYQFQNITTK
ncbi:stage II sporulation protein M [Flavobacterium agricola]|uniref:Stage II sporulation protein M n=1 Tax=Flavobacterium agricola TaxID=2870839 RepID=A0ABY6LW46_9FLAO|nr:stage II sporulation protein M [Flavobacterium agricola]UYW00391.1 stage II sporulation protein M [Flavobacterium agricola]